MTRILRHFEPRDRDPFARLNADPEVMKYFPGLYTPHETDELLEQIAQHWSDHGFGPWAVEVDGAFAGLMGLKRISPQVTFVEGVELGYRFLPEFWGRGLATEAASAAARFGFEELGLPQIAALTHPANTRSRRLMEKLGMHYEGEYDHPRVPEGNHARRHAVYVVECERFTHPSTSFVVV